MNFRSLAFSVSSCLLVACQLSVTPPPPAGESLLRAANALQGAASSASLAPTAEGLVPRFPEGSDVRVDAVLAARSGEWSRVTDRASGLGLRMRLLGTVPRDGRVEGGAVTFPRALDGFDVVIRAGERALEDFVVFPHAPAVERLRWELELDGAVAGLRLIENTLELLDAAGAPRLRVGPVRVIDSAGRPHDALPQLEGCAADRSPVAPWGRPVTAPGAARCTLAFTWSGVEYPAVFDPTWTTTLGTLNDRRSGAQGGLLPSGKILAAGGLTSAAPLTPVKTAELYDENTGTWARTGDMSITRSEHHGAFTSANGGRFLVAGGNTGSAVYESYDPATGTWTAGTNALSATGLGYPVLVTLADGRILIHGGQYQSGCGLLRSGLSWVWNPATNAVTATGSMSFGRVIHNAVLLPDGRVLAAGGEGGCCTGACLPDSQTTELWSPTTGVWTAGPNMARARSYFAIEPLGGQRFLVLGGLSNGFATPVQFSEVYTAVAGGPGTFGTERSMGAAGAGHFWGTALASGKVLFAGGWRPSPASIREAAVYDSTLNTWAAETQLLQDRRGHLQVKTAQGRALLIGGFNSSNTAHNTSELYDAVANGGACTGPGVCASGFCVDGVCCNSACSGTCQRCDGPTTPGTCAAAPLGTTPRAPGCTGNLVCDGASQTCPTMCTSNQGCTGTTFCNAGACTPKRPNGQSCSAAQECTSGFCADGFCCNTACNGGGCDACSVAAGSTATGTCTVFAAGAAGDPVCAPFVCTGASASCPVTCVADTDCVAGRYCASGSCVPKQPPGQACAGANECASNFCVDGVCCTSLCNGGACDACNAPGAAGTCTVLAAGQQGAPSCAPYLCDGASAQCPVSCTTNAQCTGGTTCSSAGTCAVMTTRPLGQTCTADANCASGNCVDGVCCNTACTGACEVCNASGSSGTCTPLAKGAEGGPTCAPFTCDGASGACPGTCAADADCTSGAFCVKGVCDAEPRGQLGFGCGCGTGGVPALWLLAGLVAWSRRRARGGR